MKGIVVELFKDITKSSNVVLNNASYYKALGHFDHFCCRITNSISKFSENEHNLNKGHDSQIMYLFNYSNVDNKYVNDTFPYETGDLPIRVLSLIQTKNNRLHDNVKLRDRLKNFQAIIDKIIDDICKTKITDEKISAEIFYTLGCTDLAIIIDSNKLSLIPEFLGKISQKISHTSSIYSIVGFNGSVCNQKFSEVVKTNNDLELSLRLTLNRQKENSVDNLICEFNKLNSKILIEQEKINYTITHLLGNYDLLVLIDNSACYVLEELLKPDGTFNLENPNSFCSKTFDRVRPTLRFKNYKNILGNCEDSNEKYLSDNVDKEIIEEVKNNAETLFSKLKNSNYEHLKQFSMSLKPQLDQLIIFCDSIRENYTKNVNPEFWEILKPNIIIFSKMLMSNNALALKTIKQCNNALLSITSFVTTLSEYLSNLLHLHRNFLEERGMFDFNISSNTKLLVAYNQFANYIKDILLDMEYESNTERRNISIYVTSRLDSKITSSKLFDYMENFGVQDTLININIPTSCLFNITENLACIIHEVAHFVGPRNRKVRTGALSTFVSKIVASNLFSTFYFLSFPDTDTDIIKERNDIPQIIKDFSSECDVVKINKRYLNEISQVINRAIKEKLSFEEKEEKFFILNNFKKNIIDVLTVLLISDSVIFDEISKIQNKYDSEIWRKLDLWILENNNLYSEKDIGFINKWLESFYPTEIQNTGKKEDIIRTASWIGSASHKKTPKISIPIASAENIVQSLFNGVSEAFCDLMMVIILDLPKAEYERIVKITRDMSPNDSVLGVAGIIRLLIVEKHFGFNGSKAELELLAKVKNYFNYYEWVFDEIFEYFSNISSRIPNANKEKINNILTCLENKDELLQSLYNYSYSLRQENKND